MTTVSKFFWDVYISFLSLSFIPNWIIDSSCKSILDLGCGQGLQMKTIKLRYPKIYAVGVDLYKPYIDKCRKENTHDKFKLGDIRKLKLRSKSIDVVLAAQVLEHMSKKDALALIKKMEGWAKKWVIISTPVGKVPYHTEDSNPLQRHKTFFYPQEFEKLGYKVIKVGGKRLFAEGTGLIHRMKPSLFRNLIFVSDIFLTPYYLIFQSKADYYFFAFKKMEEVDDHV